jgi:dihydroorotase
VRRLSAKPAEILGVRGGTLRPGAIADVTVVSPAAEWRVEASRLKSKSKNTPFLGWKMKGRAAFTLVGGRVVHEGAER